MKKLSFFLMAMLVSLTSFAAALGEGYSKVTDITTLSAGDKVVLYCDGSELGITGWDGTKTATVAAEGWVEYVVEAAEGGVLLKDGDQYIALEAKNGFYYNATGSVCKVTADGLLCITLAADGKDYMLYENSNNGSPLYRMYVDKSSDDRYKPVFVYEVVAAVEEPAEKPVVTAAELEQINGEEEIFHFYLSQGVAVDKNPESPYYGYTYVTAATDGASDGGSDRADTQKRGIFVYDAELNSLNPDNVGFLPANAAPLMTDVTRQALHRLAVNPVNNHVVFCYNVEGASAIWSMDPANLAGDAVNLIEGLAITKANAFCFDAEGTLYVMDNANTSDGGKIVKVVNGELVTIAQNAIWGVQDISLASDGRGGLWIAQNRYAVDVYAVLSHVNAAGEIDFTVKADSPEEVKALFPNANGNASYRGQCAYNVEKDVLAFGGNKVVALFHVTYDAAGVPSITKIGATPIIGSNIDGVDFYANGDLAAVSASAERFQKYAVTYTVEGGEEEPEIEWLEMPLEITNLTTEVMEVEGAKYLLLQGRDDMNDADVMLFLNNYADVDDDYEVNAESSYMTFGGLELTVLEGTITQTSETDKGTIYSGIVRTFVAEDSLYVAFDLTMYAAPATVLVLTDAIVAINEELGTLTFNVPTGDGEGYYAELAGYTAPGVHEGPQICLFMTPEAVAYTNYAETSVADGIITLKGEFVSPMGPKFDVTISGKLPEQEPVVKPEPTYTENNLNTYAFGLESELTEETLNVTYRLNNSNATSVNVLVYKGEEVVATVAGGTSIGKNVVEIATADLPQGCMLTWAVEVNGTSVEVPTQESKIYSFYHPSGLDIDNNPENPTFGMLLVNEAMQSVASKTEGYVSANFGAGIFAFTPSFDLMANGDQPGYNGGKTFSTVKNDFAPRRIRISNDGRIFATAQDGSGEYLWEINPANLNEWTTVFQGTNDGYTLKDAEGNFIAGTNSGFDVRGEGENLQLLMLSASLPGAQVASFQCHTYDLGTATTWATAPTKEVPGASYMLVTNQSNVQYDKDGGVWYIQYRGSTTDATPGLVHINKDGVEDLKLLRNYTRNAGFRFTDDFSKVIIAGVTDGSNVKKATIYAVSQDENGAPVLTEETVIETSVLGSNLNDFAWDYAGNLYACGNSAEKLVGWAMPYSGQVVTPAAAKYAFEIEGATPVEMVGVVKRAVQNADEVIVLTHEADGTAHIYQVVDGKPVAELSQEGVIAVDPENAGDYLAISDIAVTEDGKLVATNYMQTQSGDDYVDAGLKRGETRIYIWNDLHDAPSILFTSKMSSNWFRSKQGLTMAVKGTSDNMEIFMTGIHATKAWARASSYRVIDGVYIEPEVNHNDHYYFYDINDAIALETTVGTQYELNASPLGEMNWILDAELINPVEIVESSSNNVEIATSVALNEDLGKKFNGASYVTVGEKVLMVAPYATPEGKLTGVEILDITGGLDAAQYVDQLFIDEAVEATAAATAVEVVEGDEATALLITLVADATIYTLEATLANGPAPEIYEDEITNLVIDLDNLVLIGGPSSAFQVDVYLPLGEYNMSEDSYQLTAESSIAVMGSDATFIEGYAYEVDAFTPSAKAVVRCEWNGMLLEFHLTMTAEPMEATVVVVENAVVEIEKYLLWGDMYDYALKMSGEWINPEDGLTYPVLVEVPVYYPEATEPSEIMSTVTVGGWGDNDPWLGFGEGTLTVTTENISDSQKLITAKGIVQNPMAGVAIDITISGKLIPSALDNVQVQVKTVKMIKNNQLIIVKDGVEYNVQGAVIK